jgi:hypothetical protein
MSSINIIVRLVTDRIVGSPIPEYELIFLSGSEMRSTFKISRNDRNIDPLSQFRSDPLHNIILLTLGTGLGSSDRPFRNMS